MTWRKWRKWRARRENEMADEDLKGIGYAPLPDGGRLAYEVLRGPDEGPPILLHRPLGGTTALWGPFREALSGRFRVISFDPRGVGCSSEASPLTTTRSMAHDALALLDHLRVEEAHVFGLSLGGMAAMWIALDAPSRVAKLVLASTTDRGIAVTGTGVRRGLGFARCLAEPGHRVEACLARRILSRRFREERAAEVERIDELIRESPTSRANILKLAAAAARHDVRRRLTHIKSETLVLAAKDDPLLDILSQEALAARIPNATFDVISPSGHDMSLEQPVATAARVAQFILGS
jgi:pimeloyl-ACP methyl ester carboxylesterase